MTPGMTPRFPDIAPYTLRLNVYLVISWPNVFEQMLLPEQADELIYSRLGGGQGIGGGLKSISFPVLAGERRRLELARPR
jgi:hypothetical protein